MVGVPCDGGRYPWWGCHVMVGRGAIGVAKAA